MSVLFKSDVLNLLQKKMTQKIKRGLFHRIYYVKRENDSTGHVSVLVLHASHVLLVTRTCHDWGVVVADGGGHPPISSEVPSLCITDKNL